MAQSVIPGGSTNTPLLSLDLLKSKQMPVTKKLADWVMRCQYVAKTRSSQEERQNYEKWVLTEIAKVWREKGAAGVVNEEWSKHPVTRTSKEHVEMPPEFVTGSMTIKSMGVPVLHVPNLERKKETPQPADGAMNEQQARSLLLNKCLAMMPGLRLFINKAMKLADSRVEQGATTFSKLTPELLLSWAQGIAKSSQPTPPPQPQRPAQQPLLQTAVPYRSIAPPSYALTPAPVPVVRLPGFPVVAQPIPRPLAPTTATPTVKRPRGLWESSDDEGDNDLIGGSSSSSSNYPSRKGLRAEPLQRQSKRDVVRARAGPVVGISRNLERKYSRMEPTAEELRPPVVLVAAFDHIVANGKMSAVQPEPPIVVHVAHHQCFEVPDEDFMFLLPIEQQSNEPLFSPLSYSRCDLAAAAAAAANGNNNASDPNFLKRTENLKKLTWLAEQLKGMRQDITAQQLTTHNPALGVDEAHPEGFLREMRLFAKKVYDTSAKVALQLQDIMQFNQCQAQLKTLWDNSNSNSNSSESMLGEDSKGGVESEYIALRLLYLQLTDRVEAATNATSATELQEYQAVLRRKTGERKGVGSATMEPIVERAAALCTCIDNGDSLSLIKLLVEPLIVNGTPRAMPPTLRRLTRIFISSMRVRWAFDLGVSAGPSASIRGTLLLRSLGFAPRAIRVGSEKIQLFFVDGSSAKSKRAFEEFFFTTLKVARPGESVATQSDKKAPARRGAVSTSPQPPNQPQAVTFFPPHFSFDRLLRRAIAVEVLEFAQKERKWDCASNDGDAIDRDQHEEEEETVLEEADVLLSGGQLRKIIEQYVQFLNERNDSNID